MFESIRRTVTGHKQIVIAALAVSGMLLYAIPAQQFAVGQFVDDEIQEQNLAQDIIDRTRQNIDQDATQDQTQDQNQENNQDIDQTNEANVDQSEENNQANVIETGDNTASVTQVGDNDAIGNKVEAESEGGDAEAKSKKYGATATGGSSSASASIEQEVDNEANVNQDSSADDNILANENTFGDDRAFVDQDNRATQDAVNVGIQTQEQDIDQYALNQDITAAVAAQTQELCDPADFSVNLGTIVGDHIQEFC